MHIKSNILCYDQLLVHITLDILDTSVKTKYNINTTMRVYCSILHELNLNNYDNSEI